MEYVVFLGLVPVALLLLAGVGVTAWRRRQLPESYALVALAALCAGWVTTNALEVLHPTPEGTYRLAQLTYLFSAFAPVAWLGFAWTFAGRPDLLRSKWFVWLVAIQTVTVGAVLTNPLHGLVWRSVTYVPVGRLLGISVSYGPWFYVFALHCWVAMMAGSYVVLREYAEAYRGTRRLSAFVALGALVPLVLNVLYVGRVFDLRKDFTPLATSAGAVLMAVGLSRYRLLAYRPVARGVLVEGMREGMLALDLHDRIVDANPAVERILGLQGRLLGRPASDVLPTGVLDGASEASTEVTLGAGRTYDVRVSALTARRGASSGRLVLFHDTTERRAAEAALRHANAELQARNEDLDAFARTVAHDLKNPIHVVHGYASLLQDDPAMPGEMQAECLDMIVRTSQKMDGIVQALLLLAGVNRQTVEPAPVPMGEVVARVLERLAPHVTRSDAAVTADTAWPTVWGYAPWVEEVWVNYVTNALKYGGRPARIHLGVDAPRDGHVRFWVSDAGPGLSPEAQARLFQPFTRVGGEEVEGHGLGLSIARRITERLGGRVGVESSGVPGEGCRFYFTLPEARAPSPHAAPSLLAGVA